jgi:chemotaxis protein MotB
VQVDAPPADSVASKATAVTHGGGYFVMKRLLLPALLALLALTGCSNNKELLAQKDQQISELQTRVGSLESELSAEHQRATDLNAELEKALADYKQKENVLLQKIDDKSVVTVSDAMMFASGGVQLTQKGTKMLDQMAAVLNKYPDREVRIEGYTDNVGIALEFQNRFKSNWELSTARATSVLHYLRQKTNIDPNRLAAVGYGQYRPVADNSTPEGRAKNRRVVITVGPKL